MAGSSKEKTNRGGESRRRGHHGSNEDEENEILSEEITKLSERFQEDFEMISAQMSIKLRPYEDAPVLRVECLPGYPNICPKLHIRREGLTRADATKLQSRLQEQAISKASDGQGMLLNLVETARKFLIALDPDSLDEEPVPFNQNRVPQFASLQSRYLSDFEELSQLGEGGFGDVFLCKNKADGRDYAIKRIRLEGKEKPVGKQIVGEVAAISRLQHEHVVRYYQAWFETGAGSSEDYSGLSAIFWKHIKRRLLGEVVGALSHIHEAGIVHMDLTPNNIFLDAQNGVKIGDFGLVTVVAESDQVGSHYKAPEFEHFNLPV